VDRKEEEEVESPRRKEMTQNSLGWDREEL